MTVKLLHCADLHIDAVLSNTFRAKDHDEISVKEQQIIRDAPLDTLDNIAQCAIDSSVDAVVIAGDIFDKKEGTAVNLRARTRFHSFLGKLSDENIHVLISLGNHDPLGAINEISASWPKTVHLFRSDTPHSFDLNCNGNQIAFHGVSYATSDESRDLASRFVQATHNSYNIGVLHTNVGGDSNHSNYAPSSISTLAGFNYDYFALGHIHKREILNTLPVIAYSGNSQGLSSKPSEQVPKGCVIIEIDQPGGEVVSTFYETDVVRYTSHEIELENTLTLEDIISEVSAMLQNLNSDPSRLFLSKVTLEIPQTLNAPDSESLRHAINDSRLNTIVTSLKVKGNNTSWTELIQRDEFFKKIDSDVAVSTNNSLATLYDSKSLALESFLPRGEDSVFTQDELLEYFAKTHTDLALKGSR